MSIPEGYVALDFVGFTDKGSYDAAATYMINDLVHDSHNNIWKCIKDDTSNVEPSEGTYWTVFINATDSLAGMTATDTYGVAGDAGRVIVAQELVDAIANKVMNDLAVKTAGLRDDVDSLSDKLGTDVTNKFTAATGCTINKAYEVGNIVLLFVGLSGIRSGWTEFSVTSPYSIINTSPAVIHKSSSGDSGANVSAAYNGTKINVLSSANMAGSATAEFILGVR